MFELSNVTVIKISSYKDVNVGKFQSVLLLTVIVDTKSCQKLFLCDRRVWFSVKLG